MNVLNPTVKDRLYKIGCRITEPCGDTCTLSIDKVSGYITFDIKHIPMIIYFMMCPEGTKSLAHRNWFSARGSAPDGIVRNFIIRLPDLETNYIPNINYRIYNKMVLELVLILTDIYNSGRVCNSNLGCILDVIRRKKGEDYNIKTIEDLISMGYNMTADYISNTPW